MACVNGIRPSSGSSRTSWTWVRTSPWLAAARVIESAAAAAGGGARNHDIAKHNELLRLHRIHQEQAQQHGTLDREAEDVPQGPGRLAGAPEPARGHPGGHRVVPGQAQDQRRADDLAPHSAVLDRELGSFYRWAAGEELIERDPTAAIIPPRMRRSLPRPIDGEDLARALSKAPPQMRAMLSMAAYAGLQVQEIAGLDREDILGGPGPRSGQLRARVGHERIVPLQP